MRKELSLLPLFEKFSLFNPVSRMCRMPKTSQLVLCCLQALQITREHSRSLSPQLVREPVLQCVREIRTQLRCEDIIKRIYDSRVYSLLIPYNYDNQIFPYLMPSCMRDKGATRLLRPGNGKWNGIYCILKTETSSIHSYPLPLEDSSKAEMQFKPIEF